MLRQLLRRFETQLILQINSSTVSSNKVHYVQRLQPARTLFNNERLTTSAQTSQQFGDVDVDYIAPYEAEREEKKSFRHIVETLRSKFRLSAEDMKRIMSDDIVHRAFRERLLVNNFHLLCLEGITKNSFIQYPWIITLDQLRLKQKLMLLNTLPMKDINDFMPFMRLSVVRFSKLINALRKEADTIPSINRVYYISEKLNVEPSLVTKYLAKRLFILEMPFNMLEQNLQHMIDYKVSPMNVLKDLWAFRYTPKSVQMRLERAKHAKKNKIMPWMVRCTEPILQRSLKLSLDELAVLNGKETNVDYLAERLQYNVEEARAIMDKHPLVYHVRVTKMKEVLDYLLGEAGFERYEVAQVPRILCHSLTTTKQRLEELKKLGCRPTSLVIVCRSKREYAKFLREWQDRYPNKKAPI